MILHFLQVRVLGQVFSEMIVIAEGIQVSENHIAFRMSRILDAKMGGIRKHLAVDLLFHRLGIV